MLEVSAPVDSLPDVALVPDQLPEAVQLVALVEDQVSVEELPLTTDAGFAVRDTVGVAGAVSGTGVFMSDWTSAAESARL